MALNAWERQARAEFMKSLEPWRICEQLSVVQAAALIVEADPTHLRGSIEYREPHMVPEGFIPVYAALKGAILSGTLKATIRKDPNQILLDAPPGAKAHFQEGGVQAIFGVRPDWHGSLIEVTDLREWMLKRGIASEFFLPHGVPATDYLDPNDPRLSAKLSAAIQAWKAVTADPSLTRTKTVKGALTNWLSDHAAQCGLLKKDGSPNKQAIEEVAKVANWVTTGGAPGTPG